MSNVCVSCRNIGLGNDLDKKSIQGVVACNKQWTDMIPTILGILWNRNKSSLHSLNMVNILILVLLETKSPCFQNLHKLHFFWLFFCVKLNGNTNSIKHN